MLLQLWPLQLGCCCSCHHLPARPGNHDWLGQFLPTNSFSIFLSFRFWRNKSKTQTKVKAGASFSADFSLFLRILPSFSRRKQMCSKNKLHFFQGVCDERPRPHPRETHEILWRSAPVKFHVFPAARCPFHKAFCWDTLWHTRWKM